MRNATRMILCFLILLPLFPDASQMPVLQISVEDTAESCRILLNSEAALSSDVQKIGTDLLVRIRSSEPLRIRRRTFRSRFVESLSWSQSSDIYALTFKIRLDDFNFASSATQDPPGTVIEILPRGARAERAEPTPDDTSESTRPNAGDQARASSIKTIVIDPGHGGLMAGAKGTLGTLEKDITLTLGLKLKAMIERNLAFRVVMTRDKDVDVSLENRAAIANNNRAMVFISIHANGFPHSRARGSESYFLSLNATDEEARRLAYMENNSTELEDIEGENQDDIKLILWDMAQSAYLKQSSALAELIQAELNTLLGTVNRGVRQAPFVVLRGVACPAVLIEVAFLSNPVEEKNLIRADFQNRIVEAVYNGLSKYLRRNN